MFTVFVILQAITTSSCAQDNVESGSSIKKGKPEATTLTKSELKKRMETLYYTFYCADKDTSTLEDLRKALDSSTERLQKELDCKYPHMITIEVYPDQNAYDNALTDKSVAGSPACSGNRKILMVSPQEPIRVAGIPYNERLLMAVHEYVHLLLNEINRSLSIWIQEGVASYYGSTGGYESICKAVIDQLPVISLNELENNYRKLPAPDIYSYMAVKYIKEIYGQSFLNSILKDQNNLNGILSGGYEDFDGKWNNFIDKTYRK
jgi:hypothetical protein